MVYQQGLDPISTQDEPNPTCEIRTLLLPVHSFDKIGVRLTTSPCSVGNLPQVLDVSTQYHIAMISNVSYMTSVIYYREEDIGQGDSFTKYGKIVTAFK